MADYPKTTLVKIGSLWINDKEATKATMPLKGALGAKGHELKVLMFKNDKTDRPASSPDYRLVIEAEGNDAILALLGVEAPAPAAAADPQAEDLPF